MVLRLVCISDTHNQLEKVKIPEGDVLIHSGDFTMGGTLKEISKELLLFGKLPHKYKICIAGNHDWLFELQPKIAQQICLDNNIIYLENSSTIIETIKFYGNPKTKWFFDWAFNLPKDNSKTKQEWDKIPEDTNVLILHGPAFGVVDRLLSGHPVGCPMLFERLQQLKDLILFQCGHIHSAGNRTELVNNTLCINASVCTEQYKPINKPLVFDLDTETKIISQVFED
jgi:Icc-related predicted phosphoesterase